MSIRIRIVTLVSAACVLTASPAMAWWGDGWLEMLSGPGPFRGQSLDVRFACLSVPQQATGTTIPPGTKFGWKATAPQNLDQRAWVSLFGCHFLERDRPRVEIGFQGNWMNTHGADNPLDYTHDPSAAGLSKAVNLQLMMLTTDVRVNRVVDLGFGIGRSRFSAADEALFNDFSKFTFQPRATLRPLGALSNTNRWVDFVAIQLELTMFKGGFTAEDFGARPGTFNEPGDLVLGWRLVIDPSVFFWIK